MDSILNSHFIEASKLREDDLNSFYQARKAALVKLIERAMGKSAANAPPYSELPEFEEEDMVLIQ